MSPTYLIGEIKERNDETMVCYRIKKDMGTYILSAIMMFMCVLFVLAIIVEINENGMRAELFAAFLAIMLFVAFCLRLIRIPKLEREAVLKFIDELEGNMGLS